MRNTLLSLLCAAATCSLLAASCSVDGGTPSDAPSTEADLSIALSEFPSGFVKINGEPFQTNALYSQDVVNVWVNDRASALYRSLPGASHLVAPGWAGSDGPPPAISFPEGSVMIRQDTTTGELAIMARLSDAAATGEPSWRWRKRDANGIYDGQNCWSCHGEFNTTDGAIGVATSQR